MISFQKTTFPPVASSFFASVVFAAAFFASTSLLVGAETTRYGAVVVRATPAEPDSPEATTFPQVVFSDADADAGWKILDGEANTGVDRHCFYFTAEVPRKDLPGPTVEIVWPGVDVARVLGSRDGFEKTERGVRIELKAASAPTCVFTEIPFGAVRLGVFHNREIRRAGLYRDGEYPTGQIAAQLNYMIGSLEVCRRYGWTDAPRADFVDHINIYGFETCFPNGHRDFPPHFHLMLGWDGWSGTNVGHFLLDDQGAILKNNFWVQHTDVETFYRRGDVCPFADKTGRVVFEATIVPDGSGLVVRRVADPNAPKKLNDAKDREVRPQFEKDQEYLIRAGKNGAVASVEVCFRENGADDAAPWTLFCEATANDDATNGVFDATVRYADGTSRELSFQYDPETGARRGEITETIESTEKQQETNKN